MNISTNRCLEGHTQIHEKVMYKKSQDAVSLKITSLKGVFCHDGMSPAWRRGGRQSREGGEQRG
jgi:hypothetical protein